MNLLAFLASVIIHKGYRHIDTPLIAHEITNQHFSGTACTHDKHPLATAIPETLVLYGTVNKSWQAEKYHQQYAVQYGHRTRHPLKTQQQVEQ